MINLRWPRTLTPTSCIAALIGAIMFMATGATAAPEEKKADPEPIIQMDPYVIKGERVLPAPESWRYVMVPPIELTRGKKVVVAPGYEVLSNLFTSNTKLLITEIQYRQFAGTVLWPSIVQTLPRQPMIIVVDRNKTPELDSIDPAIIWENEPISNNEPTEEDFDSLNDIGMAESSNLGSGRIGGSTLGSQPNGRLNSNGSNEKALAERVRFVPLPRGVVRITAREGIVAASIGANGRLATSNPPDEEHLAAAVSQESVLFALASLPQKPPQWFRIGFGWLAGSTYISPNRTRITFADSISPIRRSSAISLTTILTKTDPLTRAEEGIAATFTHYGLYSYNGKYAKKFHQFVEQLAKQPFSEAAFYEVFQTSTAKMDTKLSTYANTFAAYNSHELKGQIPEMPPVIVREATQSEVARLQADSLISQGKADQALGIVRIAYWRGEREPAMLAILAGLEERCGSLERARKITQGLMALPTPPIRIFPVDAKLRLRTATTDKKPDYKLTNEDSQGILTPLARAVKAGLISEEVCALMAEVTLRSANQQPESITKFLKMAAQKYPNNAMIQNAATATPPSPNPDQEKFEIKAQP